MTDIQPGDWVKCVNASQNPKYPHVTLTLGAVYRVLAVVSGIEFADPEPGEGVELYEFPTIQRDGYRLAFKIERFRKLNRITDQFRAQLLEPVDIGADA